MTTDETTILISLLSLSDKVKTNNSNIKDEINSLNTITNINSQYNILIADNIDKMIESSKKDNYLVIIQIINGLSVLNDKKDIMLGILEAKNVDFNNKESMIDFIDKALIGSLDDFRYCTMVVRIAIFLGDSVRIKSAIDKIQSLGLVQ